MDDELKIIIARNALDQARRMGWKESLQDTLARAEQIEAWLLRRVTGSARSG
nr:hypothetical protein [uncultured Roseococcus sp.]